MAGYIGSNIVVAQVDGYQREESDLRFVNITEADSFPSEPNIGDEVFRTDLTTFFKWTGSEWIEL